MSSNTEQDPPLPWSAFLDELDQAISEPIELHCIGGFVVSLLYGLPRPTGDVDYIAAIPRYRVEELELLAGRGSKLAAKYEVHLQHVTVATVPEDYESRLKEMFPGRFKKLKILAPDPTTWFCPNWSETARKIKAMSNIWQEQCRWIPGPCATDTKKNYAPI
jgi:hypothetical protein